MDPQNILTFILIQGLIARHDGNPAEAIKHFQKAVELNSTNPEYYREIAKTL